MLVDAQPGRLSIGEQANTVETGVPHAFDDFVGRARQHVTPIAGKFDGRGKERWAMTARDPLRGVAVLTPQAPKVAAAEPANTLMNSRRLIGAAPKQCAQARFELFIVSYRVRQLRR